jgi:tRNA (guanine-N7-)-methyltransferase
VLPTETPNNLAPSGPAISAAPIRTFKARRGRVTNGQAQALRRLGPALTFDLDGQSLDLDELFGRQAPRILEIGFGMGEATAQMAAALPELDLLAVDVHTPGLGSLLRALDAQDLTNVRVAEGDALILLTQMLDPSSLDGVRIFFPDPWPKRRHTKRRLITDEFCDLLASRLRPGGRLHTATDWPHYADQISEVLTRHPDFDLESTVPWRPRTRFEKQGIDAGRPARDLAAIRR